MASFRPMTEEDVPGIQTGDTFKISYSGIEALYRVMDVVEQENGEKEYFVAPTDLTFPLKASDFVSNLGAFSIPAKGKKNSTTQPLKMTGIEGI